MLPRHLARRLVTDGGSSPGADDGTLDGTGDSPALREYVALLHRYHRALDLLSDRALRTIDALLRDADAYARAVHDLAPAGRVLDLGTGAGLPAVVVALSDPVRSASWIERRRRRAAFLRTVVARCGLGSVTVHAEDAGSLRVDELGGGATVVTAQGVGGWPVLESVTRHLRCEEAVLIARRSAEWAEEFGVFAASLSAGVELLRAERLEGGGTLVAVRVRGGVLCP